MRILMVAFCATLLAGISMASEPPTVDTTSPATNASPEAEHCGAALDLWIGAFNVPYADLRALVAGLDEKTSAFDVVEDTGLRARISTALETLLPLQKGASHPSYASVRGCVLPPKGAIVTFADGSRVTYSRSLAPNGMGATVTRFEYATDSATTAHFQLIPEANEVSYQGIWYGIDQRGDDLTRFAAHMHSLGATLVDYPGKPWSSPGLVRCAWKRKGHTGSLVCTASP